MKKHLQIYLEDKIKTMRQVFEFLSSGYLVPITFILLIGYFKFRNKINFIRFKFLSDFCVIAMFVISVDIMLFPHRYYSLDKNSVYFQDLEFMMDNYENNKSQELVKFNIKDGILEEFKHIDGTNGIVNRKK